MAKRSNSSCHISSKKSKYDDDDSDDMCYDEYDCYDEEECESEEEEDELDLRPMCKYGANCYRKNPDHLKQFQHPTKAVFKKVVSKKIKAPIVAKAKSLVKSVSKPADLLVKKKSEPELKSEVSVSDSKEASILDGIPEKRKIMIKAMQEEMTPCPYGVTCYRKNLAHYAEYSHPISCEDEELLKKLEEQENPKDEKKESEVEDVDDSEVDEEEENIAASLLTRSYSALNEDERRQLIEQALKEKERLTEKLQQTKKEAKKAKSKLSEAESKIYIKGEQDALESGKVTLFDIFPQRKYEDSPEQTHLRIAESQFYRLTNQCYGNTIKVVKIEYIVNPKLQKRFNEAQDKISKDIGHQEDPVLAFHGTAEANIPKIAETGFRVPGQNGHTHATDTGWYGKGVYFSEFPDYCMGYIKGGTKLLLSKVLLGKAFHCTKLIHGAALKHGYHSHTSPDKQELVVFNADHMLPTYIVHYKSFAPGQAQQFTKDIVTKAAAFYNTKTSIDLSPDELKNLAKKAKVVFHSIPDTPIDSDLFSGITFGLAGSLATTHAKLGVLLESCGANVVKVSIVT
eukprot:TRINITY_DN2559_c0_g1_i2.p1 TRINITY_DN2559_c0_g1~~TRINITY_DN2559_c0_g1_i2.p1  ORF type:complete len:569 (+),score=173.00 TRINITY_DN2559_c0_g1_i2:83-1789(+)